MKRTLPYFRPFLRARLAALAVAAFAAGLLLWTAHRLRNPVDQLHSALELTDRDFVRLFDLSRPELAAVRQAVRRGQDAEATRALLAHFRRKFQAQAAGPDGRTDAARVIAEADQAVGHTFTLLNVTKTLPADIDWRHSAPTDAEWMSFLNRMPWLPVLGSAYRLTRDPRYARAFADQVEEWLRDNPLPRRKDEQHPSWRLIEAARRLRSSWLEALRLFAGSPDVPEALLRRMLGSIHDHAQFLMRFRTTLNHVLVESTGLLSAACAVPEFARAPAWRRVAMGRLSAEITRQIYPDGAHAELTPGYHLLCLEHFTVPLTLSRPCGLAAPRGYAAALERMIDFTLLSQRPDGTLPLLNDTNEEDLAPAAAGLATVFARPDVLFTATRGREGRAPDQTSVAFPYSGYYVMRSDWTPQARYLMFDAGPYGGFHGHEDKLSFELSAFGAVMVTDGGAYAYTGDPSFRDYFVSTRAHNTILIDGQGQSRSRNARYRLAVAADRAKPVPDARWRSTDQYDDASGTYDEGYAPIGGEGQGASALGSSVTHTRRILFVKPDYWVIIDQISGTGRHRAEQLFHLTPDAEAAVVDGAVRSRYANGATLQVVPRGRSTPEVSVITGAVDPIQGWVATGPNRKVQAPAIVVGYELDLPATLYTVLIPFRQGETTFQVQGDGSADRLAVAAVNWRDLLVFTGTSVTATRTDKRGAVTRRFSTDPS